MNEQNFDDFNLERYIQSVSENYDRLDPRLLSVASRKIVDLYANGRLNEVNLFSSSSSSMLDRMTSDFLFESIVNTYLDEKGLIAVSSLEIVDYENEVKELLDESGIESKNPLERLFRGSDKNELKSKLRQKAELLVKAIETMKRDKATLQKELTQLSMQFSQAQAQILETNQRTLRETTAECARMLKENKVSIAHEQDISARKLDALNFKVAKLTAIKENILCERPELAALATDKVDFCDWLSTRQPLFEQNYNLYKRVVGTEFLGRKSYDLCSSSILVADGFNGTAYLNSVESVLEKTNFFSSESVMWETAQEIWDLFFEAEEKYGIQVRRNLIYKFFDFVFIEGIDSNKTCPLFVSQILIDSEVFITNKECTFHTRSFYYENIILILMIMRFKSKAELPALLTL
jgi:chaperonin cofactor prefoldin